MKEVSNAWDDGRMPAMPAAGPRPTVRVLQFCPSPSLHSDLAEAATRCPSAPERPWPATVKAPVRVRERATASASAGRRVRRGATLPRRPRTPRAARDEPCKTSIVDGPGLFGRGEPPRLVPLSAPLRYGCFLLGYRTIGEGAQHGVRSAVTKDGTPAEKTARRYDRPRGRPQRRAGG
jgi:hypothetical protein